MFGCLYAYQFWAWMGSRRAAMLQQACKAAALALHQLLLYCRYLKYLTKKYLKKHNVRDWLRVIASNKDRR